MISETDDFDKVERNSVLDKTQLRIGDTFSMILTLKNNKQKVKELTFYRDISASIQIWTDWYCDSQIQRSQTRIFNRESDMSDKYQVDLSQGDSINFELNGKLILENDTLKIVFENYHETLYLPNIHCDSILTCKLHGMWMPGRPYIADSYEYYFKSNILEIINETN
jgi:hypothetical protein